MAEIKDYSVTADDNNSASPNGMPENMAPSGVNIAGVNRLPESNAGMRTSTALKAQQAALMLMY